MSTPKKGDAVSVQLAGAGVNTYDPYTVSRVSKGKVYLDGLDQPFELDGKWTGFEIPGFRMTVLFDGGAKAAKSK